MGSVTLVVPSVRTSSYGERKFQCSAAKLWNALPAHIRESKTLNKDVAENAFVLQPLFYFFLVSFIHIYPNLALYIYCYEMIVLYLLYFI